ncbi:alanine racemase [Intrasporangium oryzae NRRL B-24470]|uniref:Alanine racemase n=1 Tax=Intrasporangium oryzae NRRL B-24470 TaxID=1386089 RepID=W9GCW4_9MICO|nr:alanine racemase [Intrasporangium oryzae]EWT03052.1 alanine racemase [Intrasporangium oryzae NRRL B-24470]
MFETRESTTAAMGFARHGFAPLAGELAEAVVDHDAVAANVRTLRTAAGTGLMAVVKADAFGHGAVPVARTCLAAGATWLGVTRIGEALELRHAGIDAPTLAWLFDPARAAEAVAAGVDLSVSSPADLAAVARVAGAPRVHLKLDTGLHRSGCPGEDWSRLVTTAADLERASRIRVVGVWSHLSHGGEPDAVATHRQLLMFRVSVDLARTAGLRPDVVHLANTAAVQANARHTAYDLVRVGAGLYGIGEGLRPALALRSQVVQVRQVAAGRGVGYDHVGRTTRETQLALVPLGFADGVPRAATGRASVWVGGRRVPLIGRVCMDQVVADIGPEPVAVGTEVIVLGPGGRGEPTARDWATWAGTNEHEIYTGIGARVARRHVGTTGVADASRSGREQP